AERAAAPPIAVEAAIQDECVEHRTGPPALGEAPTVERPTLHAEHRQVVVELDPADRHAAPAGLDQAVGDQLDRVGERPAFALRAFGRDPVDVRCALRDLPAGV